MEFSYDMSRDYRPIPPGERGLPCVTAEEFHLVTRERPKRLEGVTFDRNGDMYFTSNYEGRVYKLDMRTMERVCVWQDETLRPASVKPHRDGRLIISCLSGSRSGRIVVARPDGSTERTLAEGRDVDDVVFDADGNMYYTHFTGTVYNPVGAIYRVTPDFEHEEVFIPNLCSPNGICFSPDYSVLWITEFTAGRLLRIPVGNPGLGCVVYHFTGHHGPDSCETDADGNVYVCMFNQGRIMVFSPDGYPVAQILMPNRDVGHNLNGAHATVHPDRRECFIACSDDNGNEGSWIMRASALASGGRWAFHLN